jgi:hypothetical protein
MEGAILVAPVIGTSVNMPEFAGWFKDTRWVENLKTAPGWADANMASIREKLTEYLPKWQQKSDKPVLNAADG